MKYIVVTDADETFATETEAEKYAETCLAEGCDKVFVARVITEVFTESKTVVRPA